MRAWFLGGLIFSSLWKKTVQYTAYPSAFHVPGMQSKVGRMGVVLLGVHDPLLATLISNRSSPSLQRKWKTCPETGVANRAGLIITLVNLQQVYERDTTKGKKPAAEARCSNSWESRVLRWEVLWRAAAGQHRAHTCRQNGRQRPVKAMTPVWNASPHHQ